MAGTTLELFAVTIATISAAASAAFAGFQLRLSRRAALEEFEWRKKERAISYSVFKNPEYKDARKVIAGAFGSLAALSSSIPIQDINARKAGDPTLSPAMLLVLSHWGRLCSEIELGLVDEEAAYKHHATTMTNLFLGLREFVDERHRINPLGNPDLMVVGRRWLERRGLV